MKKAGFLLACSLTLALAAPATAQSRDAATAEALFRQGRQAMDTKNFQEACQKFAESQKLDPAAGTLMNQATCEEKLGKLASAWQHWKEAIDALPAKDDRAPFARSRVEELEKKLPRLQVTLGSGAEQGARVFRDEIELGPAGRGVPLPVDPGTHTVTVRMPGRFDKSVPVTIAVGEELQMDIQPGAVDPNAVTTGPKPRPRTLGWVLAGVGVAGVGAAATTGLMLIGTKSTIDGHCRDKLCDPEGIDAVNSGKTLVVVNTAAWIVGGLGLGLGGYFLLSGSKSQPTTALAPRIGPDGASLSCVGRF